MLKITTMVRGRKHLRSARELQLDLVAEIEAAEQRAHHLGLHVTAHALNRAKNALGWEIAGDITRAGMAARDERPK
jgi:hypothetical protein